MRDTWPVYQGPPITEKNREVVLAAVQTNGRALEYASEDLKDDPEVVLAAVRQNESALQFASARLKNDPEVSLAPEPIPLHVRSGSSTLDAYPSP